MSDGRIEDEKWVTDNEDGSISLDAYAGWTRDRLKERCRELGSHLMRWQMIAMACYEGGKGGLSEDDRRKVESLIEAYSD